MTVRIVNEYSDSDTVKLNFPILKKFVVNECQWLKVKFVEIYAPLMTKFESITSNLSYESSKVDDYTIKIFAEGLAKFSISGGYPENIVLRGATVVHADMVCFMNFGDEMLPSEEKGLRIQKLLREFPNLESLWLSNYSRAISNKQVGLPLPRFHKLERLTLCGICYGERLFELLHTAPIFKNYTIFLRSNYVYMCLHLLICQITGLIDELKA